ncbi:hypothetical protein [uncultured Alistipes sp.]|uniref:CHASE3 domain-containing protein n=1 Tax=uncultured Alistipes sp. TaxID=538949 RepID=UPI002613253F|nr:hypothetical protein [uncultured Alistipes sp.]
MTGIRKRMAVGFLSIVGLLFISGMISFFELSHLSNDAEEILKANHRNMVLAREMLDAAHEQNMAVIHMAILGDLSYDSLCRANMRRLHATVATAQSELSDQSQVDSLVGAISDLQLLTDSYLSYDMFKFDDVSGERWYNDYYEKRYKVVVSAIKDYMTSTQGSLAPRAEMLNWNAYRAVTPVLISLVVMIATVLLLYYFTEIYCVKPLVSMNRSLGQYLSFKMPFTVKAECKDEILELKEKIDSLIAMQKQTKP